MKPITMIVNKGSINTLYSTQYATELVRCEGVQCDTEILYRSNKGNLFIILINGSANLCCQHNYDVMQGRNAIMLVNEHQALEWLERRKLVEPAIEHFSHLIKEG